MPYLSVEIPVTGDWPTAEDMEARNAIIEQLDRFKIGQFSGAEAAEAAVQKTIEQHLPGREYTIRVTDD